MSALKPLPSRAALHQESPLPLSVVMAWAGWSVLIVVLLLKAAHHATPCPTLGVPLASGSLVVDRDGYALTTILSDTQAKEEAKKWTARADTALLPVRVVPVYIVPQTVSKR